MASIRYRAPVTQSPEIQSPSPIHLPREASLLRSIFISIVLVSGVVSFAQNCTTAPCVDFGSQVKATPSQIINGIGYTPVNKAGDTMSGPLTVPELNGGNIYGQNLSASGSITASGLRVTGLSGNNCI